MSQENVESFKRLVEAWNRDDFDAWIDQFDPEVEWFTLVEVYRGHAGARELGKASRAPCKSGLDLTIFVTSGNPCSPWEKWRARERQPGWTSLVSSRSWVTYRAGKIVSTRDFRSHAEGLQAAGLSE